MIAVGDSVWIAPSFLDDVGEHVELSFEPHRVIGVIDADRITGIVLLGCFGGAWVPVSACTKAESSKQQQNRPQNRPKRRGQR